MGAMIQIRVLTDQSSPTVQVTLLIVRGSRTTILYAL